MDITTLIKLRKELSHVSVTALGVDNTGTTDCSAIIQAKIDFYTDGNVVLYFPEGTYRIDTAIKLGLKTVILGGGSNKTTLYAPNGNDIINMDLTPPAGSSDPLFSGATISNIGIRGCASSLTQKGIYIYNTRYAETGLPPSELRHGIIEKLTVYDCGFGVYLGNKIALIKLVDSMVHTCHDTGIYSSASDSMIENLTVTFCKNGINSEASNCQFNNIKVYQNGKCYHGEDYTTTYGLRNTGSRSILTNIDAQENMYHGILIESCHSVMLNGVVVDSNGYQKAITPAVAYAGTGCVLYNVYNVVGKVVADNYHTTKYQNYGLSINAGSHDVSIEYTEYNQVNAFNGTPAINAVVSQPSNRLSQTTKVIANDFIYTGNAMPWVQASVNSGTFPADNGTAKHPGVGVHTSSTSANSGNKVTTNLYAFLLGGGEKTTFIFKPASTLAGVTRRMGFHNTGDYNAPVDGVYCSVIDGVLTGKCSNNSTTSTTSSTYTLASGTWYRLIVELNYNATLATFTLYADDSDTFLWQDTLSTNIPTTRVIGHADICTYSGTSAIAIGYLDYMNIILPNSRRI